jgi:NarL family two-component system sensor histidine kinase LiaS
MDRLRNPFRRLFSFFRRLQWKLTLSYTLFTVVTTLILGILALALLWYINFQSKLLPSMIAESLSRAVPAISSYLERTPPDQEGLNNWLQTVTPGNNLIINVPREDSEDEDDIVAAQFGRVALVAIVDAEGKVVAATPPEVIAPDVALQLMRPSRRYILISPTEVTIAGVPLQPQLSPTAAEGFQAALRGETDPSLLSARDSDGYSVATVPIFGAKKQVLGAIFVKLSFPIGEGEFLWAVLRSAILPVALGMLVVGVLAGVLFGFLIARGLTRRLRALDEATDAWSRGNFDVLARDAHGDELGQLTRHLNHMAIQLQNLLQTRQELATLEERNRLARDLHDSVKQQVFATAMQVGAARALLEQSPDTAKTHLAEAEQLVRQAQQELTTLIQELRPAALESKGLATALRDYVADWSRQSNISTEVRVQGERSLPLVVEQTLFRVAQEALANVARHGEAATAKVYLVWDGNGVTLTVSDDGQGFNMAAMNGKGMGLQSMRERVEALGGHLAVESKPKVGTEVTAQLANVA